MTFMIGFTLVCFGFLMGFTACAILSDLEDERK
jgi:hypothetical protein